MRTWIGDGLQSQERGLRGNHLDLRLPASRTERQHIPADEAAPHPHLWCWLQLPQETPTKATKAHPLPHRVGRGVPSLLLTPGGFSAVTLSAPHSTHVESSKKHPAGWNIRGQEDVPT